MLLCSGMTPNEKFMEQVAEKFPNPESDHIAVVNQLTYATTYAFAKCVRTPTEAIKQTCGETHRRDSQLCIAQNVGWLVD